jgi:hypothetical protein
MRLTGDRFGVFSLSSFGGEGWGEEAVRLILNAIQTYLASGDSAFSISFISSKALLNLGRLSAVSIVPVFIVFSVCTITASQ